MAIREDLVASAVTFLQDPNVSASPIENRLAFLQSKNLTQEEVDVALARAGGESPPSNYYPSQQQASRQASPQYSGGYQQYPWQQSPPPEVPKRDWRDWFIMATVMGGVGYGLYFVAKRYVVPLIAPPTPPQIEQDKQAIDTSFEKAFALIDQLAKDTETLKASEAERTTRLDSALNEVESVIAGLKESSRRREEESRRISDEVLDLKKLIPQAMDGHKESTDTRLRELNSELKSLKMLMGQRINSVAATPTTTNGRTTGTNSSASTTNGTFSSTGASASEVVNPRPASVSTASGTEATASLQGTSSNIPFSAGIPAGRAPIPAWQMAAAKKAAPTPVVADADTVQEASGGA